MKKIPLMNIKSKQIMNDKVFIAVWSIKQLKFSIEKFEIKIGTWLEYKTGDGHWMCWSRSDIRIILDSFIISPISWYLMKIHFSSFNFWFDYFLCKFESIHYFIILNLDKWPKRERFGIVYRPMHILNENKNIA